MTRRSLLLALSVLLALTSTPPSSRAATADASDFMNALWNRTAEVLAKKIPPAERFGTGSFPAWATILISAYGAWCSFALA